MTKSFAEFVDSSDMDGFAKVMVSILNQTSRTLPFLRSLIFSELQTSLSSLKGSILRGNNVTTKMEGAYVSTLSFIVAISISFFFS